MTPNRARSLRSQGYLSAKAALDRLSDHLRENDHSWEERLAAMLGKEPPPPNLASRKPRSKKKPGAKQPAPPAIPGPSL